MEKSNITIDIVCNISYNITIKEKGNSLKLINARYKLNTDEVVFLLEIITQIEKEEIFIDKESYDIKFIKKFSSKSLEISTYDSFAFLNWCSKIEVDKNSIKIELQSDIKTFLLSLSRDLSQKDLKNFFLLSSNYSRAIYKLLKVYEHKNQATINLQELKSRLQVPKGLYLYSNFKMKVLNVAQEELKESSDISFELEEKKDGKKVSTLIFKIDSEDKHIQKVSKDPVKTYTLETLNEPELKKNKEKEMVKKAIKVIDEPLSAENEEIKRVINLFDYERKKLQPNYVRKEFKNIDGEYLLRIHLKETKRTPEMFFDAIRWLFSNNPQATFHRQNIMNIGKLIENYNTLEHQSMYSQKAVTFNEEAQSFYNIYKKRGLSESEILRNLREGGFIE